MTYIRLKNINRPGISQPLPPSVPFEIRLSATAIGGIPAATKQLNTTVYDHYGVVFVGATIVWSTTNAAVATVNGTGLVTFVGTGSCRIQAQITAQRVAASCLVGVPSL
jgi:hypothetical protein